MTSVRRFLRRSAARDAPWLLKPMRLIRLWSATRRNRRGEGLPGCGSGVTVPISTNENPKAPSASNASASLSKPAAMPTGVGNLIPKTVRDSPAGRRRNIHARIRSPKGSACTRRNKAKVKPCARSGEKRNSSGRINVLYITNIYFSFFSSSCSSARAISSSPNWVIVCLRALDKACSRP